MRWPAFYCPEHPAFALAPDLSCPLGCHYDVRVGIPRFATTDQYAASWGPQWKAYRLTQLDSHTGLPITRDRLRRLLGEELWDGLEGKHVLEVACGAGRFTEILLERGAFVTAVDLSAAIDANRENFRGRPRYRAVQADAYKLPFQGGFDAVLAIGMLQHTPAPNRTIRSVARQAKPGGWVVVDHYPRTWTRNLSAKVLWRQWLKRVGPDRSVAFSNRLADIFLPLHRAAGNRRFLQSVLARISPVCHYYLDLPELSPSQQEAWARLDTHDALTDTFKHGRTPEEIDAALAQRSRRCRVRSPRRERRGGERTENTRADRAAHAAPSVAAQSPGAAVFHMARWRAGRAAHVGYRVAENRDRQPHLRRKR